MINQKSYNHQITNPARLSTQTQVEQSKEAAPSNILPSKL